ncbi:N-6 DNA methylase [Streptomyces sp. NPDC059209]|uniref:N-6 DNA methylase n=1 Tax=Streptomyces sp. NPDC059209 TaxID=3346769 RepID=UPI003687B614
MPNQPGGSTRASDSFAKVWRALDVLRGHVTSAFEYQLVLRMVVLRSLTAGDVTRDDSNPAVPSKRAVREDGWSRLVACSQRVTDGDLSVTTEDALREAWDEASVAERVGLHGRGLFNMPQLSEQADRALAELVQAVDSAPVSDGLFNACLARYSRRLGEGGNYFTPQHITRLMVSLASPRPGERVLDPACGSGGFLVEAARQVRARTDGEDDLVLMGRDINNEARQIAAMNLAANGLRGDLGRGPADSLRRLGGPTLECDLVLVNPPFNASNWGDRAPGADSSWRFGEPPRDNANFAWVQRAVDELSDTGRAVVLMADSAATGARSVDQEIRKGLVESDVLAALVALPKEIFPHARTSACVWILCEDRKHLGWGHHSRSEQVLFIDADSTVKPEIRGYRALAEDDIRRIATTFSTWRGDYAGPGRPDTYEDVTGWCRSVSRTDIEAAGYDLRPSRYVLSSSTEVAELGHVGRTAELTRELYTLFEEAHHLEQRLRTLLDET